MTDVLITNQAGHEQRASTTRVIRQTPNPALYITIFSAWLFAVVWFQPRLWELLAMASNTVGLITLGGFIFFINFAWLYGIYNASIVVFSLWYRCFGRKPETFVVDICSVLPPVAILYTTYNDFVERSAISCVNQDYPSFTVYLLDDSTDPESMAEVDRFASRFSDRVRVVRRDDRVGFKAGNLNNCLRTVAKEKYYAIADADEVLPENFLTKLVPMMELDAQCGFVQANHRANPDAPTKLARSLGVGIDIHWSWYQPLRNDFGFVMFLGHGALLRRSCWEEIGGFPNIVSEDLGYAIEIREKGYRGGFAEDVVCFEDFPETVRAFRIRHMKWTRGTCEFLAKRLGWLIRAKNISWTEKLDIIFPTFNLPLTLLYLLFMLNANVFLPLLFGEIRYVTVVIGDYRAVLPSVTLNQGFSVIHSADFALITLMTFFSPVLCFILALFFKPLRLFKFLCHSTSLYAALSPLSSIGVVSYLISGKATFLVTGDANQTVSANIARTDTHSSLWGRVSDAIGKLTSRSHPDQLLVQSLEIGIGLALAALSVFSVQISLFGLSMAFLLMPVMHRLGWENKAISGLVYVPFILIIAGIGLAGLSMYGMQSVFFGYGFHF